MQKTIIFSHDADIDGLGNIVLGNIAFQNLEYHLYPSVELLEKDFRNYIESGKLEDYDNIYVTDLALYDPSLTMVEQSSLRDKVHVFDHHQRAIDSKMDRYDFTTIIEEDEKGKKCGTGLFYEHLINTGCLKSIPAVNEFVELTRLEDTWEWKKNGDIGIKAHDLAILFNIIGKEEYIKRMTNKLLMDPNSFEFDSEELELIQNKKKEYDQILANILQGIEYFYDDRNDKFGIVFANYEYRNELAEYISRTNNPEEIMYLIIVAMDKGLYGQMSYRSIKKNFDVNRVAMLHGGGGHLEAASANITKEQNEKILTLDKKAGLKYLAGI